MTDDIVTRLRNMETRIDSLGAYQDAKTAGKAAAEIERLRTAYKDLFQVANHAYCYNNFGVLQAHMKEHQATAKELGLYP